MFRVEKKSVCTIGRNRQNRPYYKTEIRFYIIDENDNKPVIYDSEGYFWGTGVYYERKRMAQEECDKLNSLYQD